MKAKVGKLVRSSTFKSSSMDALSHGWEGSMPYKGCSLPWQKAHHGTWEPSPMAIPGSLETAKAARLSLPPLASCGGGKSFPQLGATCFT